MSDVTMALGDPMITATLARLPLPQIGLVVVGVAKALAVFFESPIITLVHASNALAGTRQSRPALLRFTLLALYQMVRRYMPIEIKSAATFHASFAKSIHYIHKIDSEKFVKGAVIYAGHYFSANFRFLVLRKANQDLCMSFEPRSYQIAALEAVIKAYSEGKRQLLLRLPTGAGKTVISALLIEQLLRLTTGKRILFLAHRREIIDQTAEKFCRQIGADQVAIEQAERRVESDARVVVASIQTLAGRLEAFPAESYGAIIIDECHHAYAKTWMDIITHFGNCSDSLLLGLTATPRRSDGRCISELFRETVFEISLGELQEQGFLVPMDYYTVEASLGLEALSIDQSGDFQSTLLGKIMNSPEVRQLTVRACLEKARGKKTIAFCASVDHAEDLAFEFQQQGIKAAFISGKTVDRASLIDEFRAGKIQVLSNFGVLTEGFDDPSIECVLLARPTTSPLVYSQCLGRGLRSHPGKHACTVIDIVDRQRQQLQYNAFEAAGLKRSWRGTGHDPLREAAAIARIRVSDPTAFLKIRNAVSLSETQSILMDLDPRTVFAGIDGMPLVRYQVTAAGNPLPPEQARTLVQQILQEAQVCLETVDIGSEKIEAQITCESSSSVTPYLAWHLEQATGYKVSLDFQIKPTIKQIASDQNFPDTILVSEPLVISDQKPDIADFLKSRLDSSSSAPVKSAASSLNLKDRLNRLIHEARSSQPTIIKSNKLAEDEATLMRSSDNNLNSDKVKGLSIGERLKAIKADITHRNSNIGP